MTPGAGTPRRLSPLWLRPLQLAAVLTVLAELFSCVCMRGCGCWRGVGHAYGVFGCVLQGRLSRLLKISSFFEAKGQVWMGGVRANAWHAGFETGSCCCMSALEDRRFHPREYLRLLPLPVSRAGVCRSAFFYVSRLPGSTIFI